MTKCQQAGCPNSGPERIYTRGDYQQPLGPWCDSCWAIIEERSHELMGTFDELKPTIGPKRAYLLVDQMIDQEAS